MELSGTIVKVDGQNGVIVPDNAADLGTLINSAAKQKRIAVKQNSLVACMEDFHRQKEVLQAQIDVALARMAQIDERLKDVEAGKFAVTADARIIFPHLSPPHIG